MDDLIRQILRPGKRLRQLPLTLLLCLFTWNQFYVPIHLAGNEHFTAADPCSGGSNTCSHDSPEEDEEGDGHEAHAASDHLSGFLSHAGVEAPVVFAHFAFAAFVERDCPGESSGTTFVPPARGPPAVLSNHYC